MIGRITGLLLEKNPPLIVVDVRGLGYEIDVPMSTFYNLPNVGETVSLHTHLAIREDGHFLYGFLSEAERAAFRQLLKISGRSSTWANTWPACKSMPARIDTVPWRTYS